MRISMRIIMTTLIAAILAVPVLAQQGQPDQRRDGKQLGNLGRCLAIVDLDEGQKEQVRALIESSAPTIKALHDDLRADKEALKALLEGDSPDKCALGEALLNVDASREAVREQMEILRDGIAEILTPEQDAKLSGCLEALRRPRGDHDPED